MHEFIYSLLFKPKFKLGDIIIDKSKEFFDSYDFVQICAVGKRRYQYQMKRGGRSESPIYFIDDEYRLATDEEINKYNIKFDSN